MTESISFNSKKELQTQAQKETGKKEETKQAKASVWEETKAYAKGFAEGFTGYYSEKYEGTTGIGDALSRTNGILNEGFGMMDDGIGLTSAKQKVKDYAKKVDKYIDDGDDTKLSLAEKSWEVAKNLGEVADDLVSTKGVSVGCLTAGAGIGAATVAKGACVAGTTALAAAGHTTAATVVAAAPAVVVDTAIVGGAATATVGAGQIVLANTKEEVKSGTQKVVTGASIASVGIAMAPGAVEVAQAGGIAVNAGANAVANCFNIPGTAAKLIMQDKMAETSLLNSSWYINPNSIPQLEETLDASGKCISQKVITDGKVTAEYQYKYNADGKMISEIKHTETSGYSKKKMFRRSDVIHTTKTQSTHTERTRFNPDTGKEVSKLSIDIRDELHHTTYPDKGVIHQNTSTVDARTIERTTFTQSGDVKSVTTHTSQINRHPNNESSKFTSDKILQYDKESGILDPIKRLEFHDGVKTGFEVSIEHAVYEGVKHTYGKEAAQAYLRKINPKLEGVGEYTPCVD